MINAYAGVPFTKKFDTRTPFLIFSECFSICINIAIFTCMPKIKLIDIASARSGDKNDICNIGVMARDPKDYPLLKKYLTAAMVKQHFGELIKGEVVRYEWDALESLNFVCHEALDGGGSSSMRMDNLGKNFSSHLLRLELEVE